MFAEDILAFLQKEFKQIGPRNWRQIIMVLMRYAFDPASHSGIRDMPERMKQAWPFYWMKHYVDLRLALETIAQPLVKGTIDISSWSPDGSRIVFYSVRDGDWDIYAMNDAGGEVVNLTNNETNDQTPVWRP